jgi:hypothetical protein
VLTACGGGGGGGGGSPSVNTAEGLWQGPSSTGATVTVAVLENGESWGGATVGNTLVSALAGTARRVYGILCKRGCDQSLGILPSN